MRHSVTTLLVLLVSLAGAAQDFDRQIFSDNDIAGTARYVSMGGAFSAVGGDVSAVVDNPAALGIFRHGEVQITGDFMYDAVSSGIMTDRATRFSMPQLAWVINFNHGYDKQKGMLQSSVMLQYHRLKTYRRNASFAASSALSLTDLMADLTNGLTEDDLRDSLWYYSDNVGTLSEAGYRLRLIEPSTENPKLWNSSLKEGKTVNNCMQVSESGSVNEYSLAWGGNISNLIYIGIGANLRSLSYSRTTTYEEEFASGNDYRLSSSLVATGFGFNGILGLIARPVSWLRLGISYQTPTWLTLTESWYTNGNSRTGVTADFNFVSDKYTENTFLLPMKTTCGVSFQIAQFGLFSLEYDWTHQLRTVIPDIHRMKIGTEWVLHNNFFLRAGYTYTSSFLRQDQMFVPAYYDLRADTDFRNIQRRHYVSAGFGFRNRFLIVEAAYQCRIEKSRQYAYAMPVYEGEATEPARWESMSYDMTGVTHRIVLSVGWAMRR